MSNNNKKGKIKKVNFCMWKCENRKAKKKLRINNCYIHIINKKRKRKFISKGLLGGLRPIEQKQQQFVQRIIIIYSSPIIVCNKHKYR